MTGKRAGFTILELLTVLVIVGLLATIAVSRFWTVKERSYKVAVKEDLRAVAVHQERFFEKNMTYAASTAALADYNNSPGVQVNITWANASGWAAQATHTSLGGEQCGYFTGPAPAGVAAPAVDAGSIACD